MNMTPTDETILKTDVLGRVKMPLARREHAPLGRRWSNRDGCTPGSNRCSGHQKNSIKPLPVRSRGIERRHDWIGCNERVA